MKPFAVLVCMSVSIVGCATDQQRGNGAESPSEPVATAEVSSSPPLTSATVTATAAAPETAAPVPAEPPMTEEQKFWFDLGVAINQKLEKCKTGWTGDGEITVKDGKISKLVWLDISPKKTTATPVPSAKGAPVPAIPSSLAKLFEKPVAVSLCTGTARSSSD